MSFLELEGLHVFVTGAAGGIGSAIVEEFLGRYCDVECTLKLAASYRSLLATTPLEVNVFCKIIVKVVQDIPSRY